MAIAALRSAFEEIVMVLHCHKVRVSDDTRPRSGPVVPTCSHMRMPPQEARVGRGEFSIELYV